MIRRWFAAELSQVAARALVQVDRNMKCAGEFFAGCDFKNGPAALASAARWMAAAQVCGMVAMLLGRRAK